MISIQIVPKNESDIYKLLRDKVTHEAKTWYWSNKGKTKLQHNQSEGYIEVGSADGVLIAKVYPKKKSDLFYIAEKFIGKVIS
ncbi:MAG: hypothetical protein SNJ71_00545, partial [Bacteroidales bacterium]